MKSRPAPSLYHSVAVFKTNFQCKKPLDDSAGGGEKKQRTMVGVFPLP